MALMKLLHSNKFCVSEHQGKSNHMLTQMSKVAFNLMSQTTIYCIMTGQLICVNAVSSVVSHTKQIPSDACGLKKFTNKHLGQN